jgi:hypothetical protein
MHYQVPFQPASLIFVGIDAVFTVRGFVSGLWRRPSYIIPLHQAAEGVSASYDALLELFECIANFLKRLEIYTNISLSPLMTDIIAKIMADLICVLALARKQIKQGRLSKLLTMFSLPFLNTLQNNSRRSC